MSEHGGWCHDCLMPFNRIVFEFDGERLVSIFTPDDFYCLSPGEQWDYSFLSRYVGWHVVEVRVGHEHRYSVIVSVTETALFLSSDCDDNRVIH